MALRHVPASLHWRPGRSAAPLRRPGQQQTSSGGEKYSGLASNLAHLGRICYLAAAVCGLSQHLLTYMRPSPLLPPWNRCSDRRKSIGPSAPIAYATSVSPPDEAVAWPGRRCWVLDMAVAWPEWRYRMANDLAGCSWRSSCKSPRTPPKCKYLITRQLTFINALGELKSRPPRGPMCPRGA